MPYVLNYHFTSYPKEVEIPAGGYMLPLHVLGRPHVASVPVQPARHTQANFRSLEHQLHYDYPYLEFYSHFILFSVWQPRKCTFCAVAGLFIF